MSERIAKSLRKFARVSLQNGETVNTSQLKRDYKAAGSPKARTKLHRKWVSAKVKETAKPAPSPEPTPGENPAYDEIKEIVAELPDAISEQ